MTSEKATVTCQDCGGSGMFVCSDKNDCTWCMDASEECPEGRVSPCTTCSGTGRKGIMLVRECEKCKGSGYVCTFHDGPVNDVIVEGCECEYSDEAKSYKLHQSEKCENEERCDCDKGEIRRAMTAEEVSVWLGQVRRDINPAGAGVFVLPDTFTDSEGQNWRVEV